MREFSENLKEARLGLGLTQKGLAEVLEVNRKTIMRWEKNQHSPTIEHAVRAQEIMKTLEAKSENQKDR